MKKKSNIIWLLAMGVAFVAGAALLIRGIADVLELKEPQPEEKAPVQSDTVHVDYDLSGYGDSGTSNLLQHYMEANEHVIARMYIPDTEMETPIMDDEFYFRHNLYGQYDTGGVPFVEDMNHFMKPNQNALIYGHRLRSGTDFGMLKSYLDQAFYEEHPDIKLETTAGETSWHILSVFSINIASDSFAYTTYGDLSDTATRNTFFNGIKQRNEINTGDYSFKTGDEFITLSTCHYEEDPDDGRLVVVAVRS